VAAIFQSKDYHDFWHRLVQNSMPYMLGNATDAKPLCKGVSAARCMVSLYVGLLRMHGLQITTFRARG
jgi:hypothetical protein